MAKLSPQAFQKFVKEYQDQLDKAKGMKLKVGLPKEAVGGQAYGNGTTVIEVGTIHEFGNETMPVRSFLRMPFLLKRAEIDEAIQKQFKLVGDGKQDAKQALERVGLVAENISRQAFTTRGFGKWKPSKKESGQTLIDKSILRNSITSFVEES